MRLLNAKTLKLKEFMGDDNLPPYAILSHTWGEDEVSYQEINTWSLSWGNKEGYLKIKNSCNQAIVDGLDWVWVDTCCIDKTSSAELSEAINSMFRWYEKANVCYAYLSDVSGKATLRKEFVRSRWFTRGWTLQELLAPKSVIFYSNGPEAWHFLGTKEDLCDDISVITGIDTDTLYGASLEFISIARKMSWASRRVTTRIEDTAYCLLGIFNVNMPLLYGEGQKAFLRLQEEIMKSSYDYSLFAWGLDLGSVTDLGELKTTAKEKSKTNDEGLEEEPLLCGLLAKSPAEFEGCSNVESSKWADRIHTSATPPIIHNRCVHIDFLIIDLEQEMNISVAVLGYHHISTSESYLGLVLRKWGDGLYSGRMKMPVLVPPTYVKIDACDEDDSHRTSVQRVRIKEESRQESLNGCSVIKVSPGCQLGRVICMAGAKYDRRNRVLSPSPRTSNSRALFIFSIVGYADQFGVLVGWQAGRRGGFAWARASKVHSEDYLLPEKHFGSRKGNLFIDRSLQGIPSLYGMGLDLSTWPGVWSGGHELRFRINSTVEVEVKLSPVSDGKVFTEVVYITRHDQKELTV